MFRKGRSMAEVTTTLTEKMREALRISNKGAAITADINDSIEACKLDLKAAGVKRIEETDALIIRAIKLFCRADFNFNGKGEQYRQSYDLQKMSLSLDGDYNTATVSETDTAEA